MAKIDLINNPILQSPHAYLQAAGSDASDGTAKGIHLRWAFRKILGDTHLAKGNLSGTSGPYPSAIGFNKNNDFVKIFRSAYDKKVDVVIKFKNTPPNLPTTEVSSGPTREWKYLGFVPVPTSPSNTTDVYVKFTDIAQYDTIRATMTTLKPEDFMKQYTGVIEVSSNKLMFAFEMNGDNLVKKEKDSATLRLETISLDDVSQPAVQHISCRQVFVGKETIREICENMPYFRFDRQNVYPTQISIETYLDFILYTNRT